MMITKMPLIVAGLAGFAAAGTAQAATAFDYNVIAFGNFTSSSTEVRGALAVGSNATLANFSVGSGLKSGYSDASLVVGNNLTYANGQVFHGNAVSGGQITASGFNVAAGSAHANAPVPLNFGAELVRLKDLSSNLRAAQSNGTVQKTWQLVFTGTNTAVNVFDVTAAQLGSSNGFAVNIPTGSVAIFNVSGSSFTTNWPGGFTLNGQTIANQSADLASSLLFNFNDASSLNFNGSWAGSVLAPTADVTLNWGAFFGSLQANNVTSSAAFYDVGFDGDKLPLVNPPSNLPPIPEPATWALMIGGFALVGLAMRRRKVAVSFS